MSFSQTARFDQNTKPHTLLNPEIFRVIRTLGSGGFGAVYQVIDPAGHNYALKILFQANPEILSDEIKILSVISRSPDCQPNIVCYYDSFILNWYGRLAYGILTEYIDGYNLAECMQRRESLMTPGEIMTIITWLAKVIYALHKKGYVHRDIKPGNIMIQRDGNLKLIDFGLSCYIGSNYQSFSHVGCRLNIIGTQKYIAPEIISHQYLQNPERYYKTADIFAFGVTVYHLLTGGYPYPTSGHQFGYKPINTGFPCLDQLIGLMLLADPNLRLTAEQIPAFIKQCSTISGNINSIPNCVKPEPLLSNYIPPASAIEEIFGNLSIFQEPLPF